MSVINSNIVAGLAQNALVKNERAMNTAMEQLSTGKRINSAADDAAGMAISSKMSNQIRGLDQAVRNTMDAVSMIQVADGAAGSIENMLQRMRELAVQASSDTNTTDDVAAINAEFTGLRTAIDNVADTTQWNGGNLIDGTQSAATFQIGANNSQSMTVDFGNLKLNAFAAGTAGTVAVTTTDGDIQAMTSVQFGAVTVNSSALLAATDTTTLTAALNADSGFAQRYTAVRTSATVVTVTEKPGFETASGPVFSSQGNLPPSGVLTVTTTAAEIGNMTSVGFGNVSVVTGGLLAAPDTATLATFLNNDAGFAARYAATSTPGKVAVTTTNAEINNSTSMTFGSITVNTTAATDTATLVTALNSDAAFTARYTAVETTAGSLVTVTERAGQGTNTGLVFSSAGTTSATSNLVTSGTLRVTENSGFTTSTGPLFSPVGTTAATSSSFTPASPTTSGSTSAGVASSLGLGANLSGLEVTSASVLTTLDNALRAVNIQRGEYGAGINRLEYTADNLANASTNTQAARSRIEDADYAKATTELARTQIIQQAGTAMLAQANQSAQGVMALLQG